MRTAALIAALSCLVMLSSRNAVRATHDLALEIRVWAYEQGRDQNALGLDRCHPIELILTPDLFSEEPRDRTRHAIERGFGPTTFQLAGPTDYRLTALCTVSMQGSNWCGWFQDTGAFHVGDGASGATTHRLRMEPVCISPF